MEHFLQVGSSDELIVVFSPINIPKGKFGLSRFFGKDVRNVLFFNCPNTWYVDCIDEMEQIIHEIISEFQISKVVLYGPSMGGYAAARIGGKNPEFTTFLFGPELKLYIPGSLSQKNATIQAADVDITPLMGLDFSNTVALFGIYEPVDLIQYEFSLGLGFYATLPVRSPHAVHEEFYYRDLIQPLATSTTCSRFVESIPLNFIDLNPPTQHSGLLYSAFFANKNKINNNTYTSKLEEISHPSAYWVLLKHALVRKDANLLDDIEKKLNRYFQENTDGFSLPTKFAKRILQIREQIAV